MRGHLTTAEAQRDDQQRRDLEQALAFFGLVPEGEVSTAAEPPPFYLWPEHVPAFRLWRKVQSQWKHAGMGGISGLDYPGVWTVLDRVIRGPRRRRVRVFEQLQVMEAAALGEWAEQRAQREAEGRRP